MFKIVVILLVCTSQSMAKPKPDSDLKQLGRNAGVFELRTKTNGVLDWAKMDGGGDIEIRLCSGAADKRRCCNSGTLDNPDKNDFELGQLDVFGNEFIGRCSGFRADENALTGEITHFGEDAWGGDFITVMGTEPNGEEMEWRCIAENRGIIQLDDDEAVRLDCSVLNL